MKNLIVLISLIFISLSGFSQKPAERAKMLSEIHRNSRSDKPGRIDNDHKQMRHDLKRDHEPRKERMKEGKHDRKHEKEVKERHERRNSKKEGR